MKERYFQIIADGEVHEYCSWKDVLEDFLLYSEDENYTTIEVYDPIIGAVLMESTEGEITDLLGLLEQQPFFPAYFTENTVKFCQNHVENIF